MAREDVNIKVSANVAEAIQLWKAMEEGPEGMAKSLEGMGRRGRSATKAIGDEALLLMGRFAGIAATIAGVATALKAAEQSANRAADRVSSSLGSAGELSQVAISPADYQRILGEARRRVAQGIFSPDQESAAIDLAFSQTSAGFSDADREFIAQLGKTRIVRPESLGEFGAGLAKIRDIFGADEAGDLRSIGAKILAGSQATQSSASQFSSAATRFGSGAVALGYSDEEALAAAAAIEKGSANIDEAATRLAALFTSIEKGGLSRGSLGQTMDALSMQVQSGTDVRSLLGDRQEAIAGFRALQQQRDIYREQLRLITSAPSRNVIETTSTFIESDPSTRAALRKAEAEGALAAAEFPESQKELLFDALRAERKADVLRRRGSMLGFFQNSFESIGAGIVDATQSEMAEFESIPDAQFRRLSPGLRNDLNRFMVGRGQEPQRFEFIHKHVGHDGRDIPVETEAVRIQDR